MITLREFGGVLGQWQLDTFLWGSQNCMVTARGPGLFKGNTLGSCQKREEREEWWRTAWEGGRLLPPKGNPPPPHLPRPFRRQTLSSHLRSCSSVPLPSTALVVCVARSRLFSFPFACSRCACSEAASPPIGGQAEGEHAGGRRAEGDQPFP